MDICFRASTDRKNWKLEDWVLKWEDPVGKSETVAHCPNAKSEDGIGESQQERPVLATVGVAARTAWERGGGDKVKGTGRVSGQEKF